MNIAQKMKREWNQRAQHHAQYWVATENFHDDKEFSKSGEETAQALLSCIQPLADASWTVLEIGCGVGRILKPLCSHFKRLVGIDVSGEMIHQSKNWLKGLNNVETIETSGVDLKSFPDETFNLVYSFVAFQHMPRPVFLRYLEESNRVLKHQGYLLFQIPIGTIRDTAIEDTVTMRQYSTNELADELERCGLESTDHYPVDSELRHHREEVPGRIFHLAKKTGTVLYSNNTDWLESECGETFSLLNTRMYLWFAEQCLQKGQDDEALRTYLALRAQDPRSLEKWIRTVEILVQQGKHEEAQDTLEKLTIAIPIYETLTALLESKNCVRLERMSNG